MYVRISPHSLPASFFTSPPPQTDPVSFYHNKQAIRVIPIPNSNSATSPHPRVPLPRVFPFFHHVHNIATCLGLVPGPRSLSSRKCHDSYVFFCACPLLPRIHRTDPCLHCLDTFLPHLSSPVISSVCLRRINREKCGESTWQLRARTTYPLSCAPRSQVARKRSESYRASGSSIGHLVLLDMETTSKRCQLP
jgi:hypothetical protein